MIEKPETPPAGPSPLANQSDDVVRHEGSVQFGAEQRITQVVDPVTVRWMALQAAFTGARGAMPPRLAIHDAVACEAYLRGETMDLPEER